MPRARCVPNVVAVNAALNVLGRAGAWREAVDLLDDMVIDRGTGCVLLAQIYLDSLSSLLVLAA
jgi:pentatricopeptide repeat protein